MGFCIYEIRRLYVEGIEILKPEGQKEFIDEVAMRFGQIGIVARSVLFAIIGVFLDKVESASILTKCAASAARLPSWIGSLPACLRRRWGWPLMAFICHCSPRAVASMQPKPCQPSCFGSSLGSLRTRAHSLTHSRMNSPRSSNSRPDFCQKSRNILGSK